MPSSVWMPNPNTGLSIGSVGPVVEAERDRVAGADRGDRPTVGVEQLDVARCAPRRSPSATPWLAVGDPVARARRRGTSSTTSPDGPTAISLPCSSSASWSHSVRIVPSACDTTTMVLPLSLSSANFSEHFRWNCSSPTASTSSTSRMSGSTLIATEKPEPHVHARRVVLHRRVDELLEAGEVDDVVEACVELLLRQAEDRAVEVDVLPARQLGVEAGAELEQRRDLARAS